VEQEDLRPDDREKLQRHLAQARELGAEVHCLKGPDFVETLLDFARRQRITQVFLGHTCREQRFAFMRSPVDRLIDAAEDFDLRLFPHQRDQGADE
jgi:two-component system, OmpR family, sensor histidine kinase KdpD